MNKQQQHFMQIEWKKDCETMAHGWAEIELTAIGKDIAITVFGTIYTK